jgi:Fe2+ or Zn2+ uptake regulation protein
MKDKELLIETVENSFQYTPKQRAMLKLFLSIEVNETVSITPRELAEIFKTSRATIYEGLKCLEEAGLIKNLTEKGKHFSIYKLNRRNFDDLVQVYLKKKDYLKEI